MSYEVFYDLSITREYVSNWGIPEAVRELLQNGVDNPKGVNITVEDNSIFIQNPDTGLSKKVLLLGSSSKDANGKTIGQFGEGFKLALLVLLRNDVKVSIRNNGVLWKPVFRFSPLFKEEVLSVSETMDKRHEGKGLMVEISGISEDVMTIIQDNTLLLQDNIGETIECTKGRILRNRPNTLFVNGLFVCNTQLDFGYDIKPQYLKLNRDRQAVSTFDLAFIAKDMWNEKGSPEDIASLLRANCPDLQYIEYGVGNDVANLCAKEFYKEHSEAIIVSSEDEAKKYREVGQNNVYVYGESFCNVVRKSSLYKEPEMIESLTPHDILTNFLNEFSVHINYCALVELKFIVDKSSSWYD